MNVSKKIRTVAALGTLSGAVWAGTFATFTDSATGSSTFTSGTVDLTLAASQFTTLSTSLMKPGDVKYAPLTVTNAGTLGYNYTMTSAETETTLSGALTLQAVKGAATCDSTGFTAALAAITLATPGYENVIPNGSLASAGISTPRAIAASATEALCVKVAFPDGGAGADNGLQGLTTTSTFTFTATQQ